MSLFSNSFNYFVLLLVGVTFVGTAYGMKSDADIIAEIIRMATAIKTECKTQRISTACSYYQDYLTTSRTVPDACTVMDLYIVCQESNCLQQSTILTQLLADAMIMPYCTELSSFVRTPETVAILSEVADIRNECVLEDNAVCDEEGSILMYGKSLRRICLSEKVYLTCLQNNCRNQSLALTQKITQALNKQDCGLVFNSTSTGYKTESQIIKDIKELNLDIDDYCQGRRFSFSCSYTNRTVFLSTTRQQTCLSMRDFALCSQQYCQPTQYLTLILQQAYNYQDCRRFFDVSPITIPTNAPTSTSRFTLRPIFTVPYEALATGPAHITNRPTYAPPYTNRPTYAPPYTDRPTYAPPTDPWWWETPAPASTKNPISTTPINRKPVSEIEDKCYPVYSNPNCSVQKQNALTAIGYMESCQTLKDYAKCMEERCYTSFSLADLLKSAENEDCREIATSAEMNLFSNYFNFLAVLLCGVIFIGAAYGLKSDTEIISEMTRMTAAIKAECKNEKVQGSCDYIQGYVNRSWNVDNACMNLESYISCQSSNCLNQSMILTQLLADAMIMPYCTILSSFVRTPETVAILNDVAEIRNMCFLQNENVCDNVGSLLLWGKSIRRICLFEKTYLTCLQNNCKNQSYVLTQKISQALNKQDCGLVFRKTLNGYKTEGQIIIDIKELSRDINLFCNGLTISTFCYNTNRTVFLSYTREKVCQATRDFAACSQEHCIKTQYLNLTLEQAFNYQDCRNVVHTTVSAYDMVQSVWNQLMFCDYLGSSGKCDPYKSTLQIVMDRRSYDNICPAAKNLIDCLDINCRSDADRDDAIRQVRAQCDVSEYDTIQNVWYQLSYCDYLGSSGKCDPYKSTLQIAMDHKSYDNICGAARNFMNCLDTNCRSNTDRENAIRKIRALCNGGRRNGWSVENVFLIVLLLAAMHNLL